MNDIKEKNELISQGEQAMGSRYIIIKIAVIFALCFMVIFGITHPSSIFGKVVELPDPKDYRLSDKTKKYVNPYLRRNL